MPYRLLVMARSVSHPDPDMDRAGCYKKGDIVDIYEPGITGAGHVLPDFIEIDVTDGVTASQAAAYRDQWQSVFQYNVLASDVINDIYQVEITNANAGASLAAGITLAKVQTFLNGWNLSFVSESPNSVVFNADIYQAAISSSFWRGHSANIVFSAAGYDSGTGTHTIQADYSAFTVLIVDPSVLAEIANKVERAITMRGGSLVSNHNSVAVFTIDRATMRNAFQDEIANLASYIWKCRRWSFSEADVDAAIAAGGRVSQTQAQVLAKLQDAMAQ